MASGCAGSPNQRSSQESRTTSPTTARSGPASGGRGQAASAASVPARTSCDVEVPLRMRATGVEPGRPNANSSRAISTMVAAHMKTTSVSASQPKAVRSRPAWPVRNSTLEAWSRCSSGMPA